jgi:hypothetical protein
MDHHMHEITDTLGFELRKDDKLREVLLPHYARSRIGQLLFFERFFDMDSLVLHSGNEMDHYIRHKQSREAKLYGQYIRFMQYFLSEDRTNCKTIYNVMRSMQPKELNTLEMNTYNSAIQVLYQSFFEEEPEQILMHRMHKLADQRVKEGIKTWSDIPVFEYTIICAMNFGNNFKEIIELYERIQMKFKDSQNLKAWKFQLGHSIYARALLNSGQDQLAKKVYEEEELFLVQLPANQKNYLSIQFNLIRIEFLIRDEQFDDAQRILEEIKTISHMLRFSYFYNIALKFEQFIANSRAIRDKSHHPPASE